MTGVSEPGGRADRRTAVWLGLIILLGFALRLSAFVWGQAYCYFAQGDGIEAYSVAVDYGLSEPRALYLGQPNFNEHSKLPGPLWTLFCFACRRAWGSVEGIAVGTLLLNTAVIYLTYVLARQTVGAAGALWAALFTATLPWAVYYSVGVYNPEVMSFLGALLFLALWRVTRVERSKVIFWVPLLLLIMPQFHMSGLTLIPAVVLVLWLSRARVHSGWLACGLVAGVALYIPYALGDMAQGWQNTRGMFAGRTATRWDSLKALSAPFSFLVNWAPEWTTSKAEYQALGRVCFASFEALLAINILSAVVAVFLIVGASLEVRRAARGVWTTPRQVFAREPGILFLTTLFLVPLLMSLASGKPFHTRYAIVLLPAMLPLAAVGVLHWLGAPRLRGTFRFGLAVICCANIWLMPAMYHFQSRQIEEGPDLIPSFRKLEALYQSLKTHAGSDALVKVDILACLRNTALPPSTRHEAVLLGSFVKVREREDRSESIARRRVVYHVCPQEQARTGDPHVAYRGCGVALIEVAASDTPAGADSSFPRQK
jgi:hypothetical protein